MLPNSDPRACHPLSMCFLCVENAARSQMAEALARTMLDPTVEIFSAGSNPGSIDPYAISVMAEIGIDISSARPKGFAQVPLERVATLVVMCPWELAPRQSLGTRVIHWGIPNPAERTEESKDEVVARYRRTRDRIAYRLRALIAELELRTSYFDEEDAPTSLHSAGGSNRSAPNPARLVNPAVGAIN